MVLIALVLLASLWPQRFSALNPIKIDTDPENMLEASEPVRLFHNEMKREFSLYDMVVVGITNSEHPQGVFNTQSLNNIFELTNFTKTIGWEENGEYKGVVDVEILSPSTVDNIEQGGLGAVKFEWLMESPPKSEAEALAIARKAQHIPLLDNTLVSQNGQALALYIPITSKNISYRVASELRQKIATLEGSENYYITGQAVAQDQFGVEMFKQMALSAPLAMLLIFLLMWLFFRHLTLIIAPMIVAMMSVIITMALLILSGSTIHIMSSMIPIFIMPIAVLDAVHILSDFFDRYPNSRNRAACLEEVMHELFKPMLFTTLTTCAGFGSLAFTPIPPVQVFGIFVAIGVFVAWFLTVTLVPAYIMLLPENSLRNFGLKPEGKAQKLSLLARLLLGMGQLSYRHAKLIVIIALFLGAGAYYGIRQISINDNPVKWFVPSHDIRVADRVLNEHFGGTYMAYLTLEAQKQSFVATTFIEELKQELSGKDAAVVAIVSNMLDEAATADTDKETLLSTVIDEALAIQDASESDALWDAWDEVIVLLENQPLTNDPFKQPEMLVYLEALQAHLLNTEMVGKINALPDIVKTVHRELFLGKQEAYRIPDSQAAVAQTLITYQNSHRPQDLWHFVTPDYHKVTLWLQLTSGDNRDMKQVVDATSKFLADNTPPTELTHNWFGLTYINVVWQERMVAGMLKAFLGSFIIVLILMTILFRSFWWGLLSMIPLTVAIASIYCIIGLIGKDYDMPVAVLSSLSLGLAIDYAIHFTARSKYLYQQYNNWQETINAVFAEPARAITRNMIVVGCGFLPLLAAPLIPYQTVGVLISAILFLAGATTLILLPALITLSQPLLFKSKA